MIKCCYKCEERVVGCHAICEKYRAEKVEHDKLTAQIREKRNQENDISASIIESIIRREKKRR